MSKERRLKGEYSNPAIKIFRIETSNYLMELSGSGGHNSAGDDGNELNAPHGWFEEEESNG